MDAFSDRNIPSYAVRVIGDPTKSLFDARPIVESIVRHCEWIHPITGQRVTRIAQLMNAVPEGIEPARNKTIRYLWDSGEANGEDGYFQYAPRLVL